MLYGILLVLCSIIPILIFCGVRIDCYYGQETGHGSGSDSYLSYDSGTGDISYHAGRHGATYYIQRFERYGWNSIYSSSYKEGYGILFYNFFGVVSFISLPEKIGAKLFKIQRILDYILPKYLHTLVISSAVWTVLLLNISAEKVCSIIVPMAIVLYIFRSLLHGYFIECMASDSDEHMILYSARANFFATITDLVGIALGCAMNNQITFEWMLETIKFEVNNSILTVLYPCTAVVAIIGILLCATLFKDD